jgi:hypothetical protein
MTPSLEHLDAAAAQANGSGYMDRTGTGLHPGIRLYIANLIHQDTRSVVKVVRYGNTIACYPDAHTVELVERQITRQHRAQ